MAETSASLHPHDRDLPAPVVRKRQRFRRIGYLMLLLAVLTAAPGWILYGVSIWNVFSLKKFTFMQALLAYSLLIVSSIALVLGLWYLLLAQTRRLSRMVEGPYDAASGVSAATRCGNCGWPHDYPDRYCRHCGKPLPASSDAVPRPPTAPAA